MPPRDRPRRGPGFGAGPREGTPSALELYLREIRREPLLPPERLAELSRAVRAGCERALDRLVRATAPLVVSVARRYRHRGVELEDLVQEGNVGLVRAARSFDPDRGVRFTTYAVWCIRREIAAALRGQGRAVRLPRSMYASVSLIARTRARLRQILFREPTAGEVADAAGIEPEEVELADALAPAEVSLDSPGSRDAEQARHRVESVPAADEGSDPGRGVELGGVRAEVERVLRALPAHHARLLRLYYGLDDGEERSLEEIGELLGVSRQSVHSMRDRALDRAREALEPERGARFRRRRASVRAAEEPSPAPSAVAAPGDLTDAQWAAVAPLLAPAHPRAETRGRLPTDPRHALDGVLWLLREDARWQDVPDRYPAARTCREHLQRWTAAGLVDPVLRALAADLEERGGWPVRAWFSPEAAGAASWQGATARLLASPATVRLLHRARSPLLDAYPPAALSRVRKHGSPSDA